MQKTVQQHSFQAEVQQVLDIVVHSLYTDKEIFVREIVSNASDALEKLRCLQATEKDIFDDKLPLEINITTDDTAQTITIQDFGVGMAHDELIENLGTIAHSGSKAFLEAIKEQGSSNENLIGQFGVGFYSIFMVAKEAHVYTHSWRTDAEGCCWHSEGTGAYTIEPSEGQRRGCKIVLTLKDEYKEFANKDRIKGILNKYSNYVSFPLNLNGDRINQVDALWLRNKNDIKEDEYKEFYKFQGHAYDEPLTWMHFSADAPLAINALIYIPGNNQERPGFGRLEPQVALHCRKILIDSKPQNLLPEWLRFLKGVVDSADLPLNISRESMQDSALMQKLCKIITGRVLKTIEELADKKPDLFTAFWQKFGIFIKEGVTSDFTYRERLSKLLRFESSTTEAGSLTSLGDYVSRMPAEQSTIYFISGPNRQSIESGPYVEAFKQRNIEVIYCYEPIDEFVVGNLGEFDGKKITSADQADIQLTAEDEATEGLTEDEMTALCDWAQKTLGEQRVAKVAASKRLTNSPAIALNEDKMMTSSMRKFMQSLDMAHAPATPPVVLELNRNHPIIKNLSSLRTKDPELAALIAEQLLDNTLIAAGLLDNPRSIIGRVNKILETVSQN